MTKLEELKAAADAAHAHAADAAHAHDAAVSDAWAAYEAACAAARANRDVDDAACDAAWEATRDVDATACDAAWAAADAAWEAYHAELKKAQEENEQ